MYDVATRSNELPASAAQKHELKKQNKTKSDGGIGRDFGDFFSGVNFLSLFFGRIVNIYIYI